MGFVMGTSYCLFLSSSYSHKDPPIPRPINLKTFIPSTLNPIAPATPFSSSICKTYVSLCVNCCSTSSSSSVESPSTIIFTKGLPLSMTEGRLKEAFSPFGEVCRVKIVLDKNSQQSLGFAYIWYASEESAQLAVKEMDGKFLDGRFIFVRIAKPGSCKAQRKAIPYKF